MIDTSKRVNAYKNRSYYIIRDLRNDKVIVDFGVKVNGNRSRYIVLEGPFNDRKLAQSKIDKY